MGVLEPVPEAFTEDVPATPPGFRDQPAEDNSEDDLFSEPKDQSKHATNLFGNDLSFQSILPVLPAKGDFTGYLGGEFSDLWELNKPASKDKYCSGCLEDVKDNLKKIREVIEVFKKERDAATEENKALKKELEELKAHLYQKELSEKGDVTVTISNGDSENIDVLLRKKDIIQGKHDALEGKKLISEKSPKYGIQSFSISLPKENRNSPKTKLVDYQLGDKSKSRKTVPELKKEFVENEFVSERELFTARHYLEIKPEVPKETVRSKMTIRIKPKKKISEIISKLTSKFIGSKVIPEAPAINMFQRFEKTRIILESGMEAKIVA